MTIPVDLLNEIQLTLGSTITPNLTSASNTSDIFEAYIFSIVIEAARSENAFVEYRDVFNNVPAVFVFRTSPGYIFSKRHPYTHAVISFPQAPLLEVHMGVRVVGRSDVLHECDVAVIEHAEAETCRRREVPPRSRNVLIAVECKFFSTRLQLHLARSFLGLLSDLSVQNPMFVTNSYSDSVEKLLTKHKRRWEHNLSPGATHELMRLRHNFQEAFKHYKAKY